MARHADHGESTDAGLHALIGAGLLLMGVILLIMLTIHGNPYLLVNLLGLAASLFDTVMGLFLIILARLEHHGYTLF